MLRNKWEYYRKYHLLFSIIVLDALIRTLYRKISKTTAFVKITQCTKNNCIYLTRLWLVWKLFHNQSSWHCILLYLLNSELQKLAEISLANAELTQQTTMTNAEVTPFLLSFWSLIITLVVPIWYFWHHLKKNQKNFNLFLTIVFCYKL